MEDTQVKQLVNKIFAMKGLPKVTKFAEEFADGRKLHNPLSIINKCTYIDLSFVLVLF